MIRIRTVLNDGMLSSYLELLGVEKRLLNDFYDREAFLRDPEHLDIARKLLSGKLLPNLSFN
jgi:RUN domain